jgi:hypothetical protein
MQGLLVPTSATGWDGTTNAYLSMKESHACSSCCSGLDALGVPAHAIDKHSAHYLAKPEAYWKASIQATTGTMAHGLINHHSKKEIKWEDGNKQTDVQGINYHSDNEETAAKVHTYKKRKAYTVEFLHANINPEEGENVGVRAADTDVNGFQNMGSNNTGTSHDMSSTASAENAETVTADEDARQQEGEDAGHSDHVERPSASDNTGTSNNMSSTASAGNAEAVTADKDGRQQEKEETAQAEHVELHAAGEKQNGAGSAEQAETMPQNGDSSQHQVEHAKQDGTTEAEAVTTDGKGSKEGQDED